MELYSTLSGIFTVVTFVTFAGIVHWAWSARRRDAFAEAANAPFALPDEPAAGRSARQREREQAAERVSARRVDE
ncbi:MAG TPA: hypothetical protein VNB03_17195 [Casimicrobiaceae bacterium]|jgi:cytochrome c oxidase cbb3-type subunit 4|nr:hypothetical protein [Casimicrobiaceae bacterium]